MVSAHAASFADLFLAVTALGLFSFLDPQTGAGTAAPAPLDGAAAEVWLPAAAAAGALTLFVTVAFMYHHLSRAGVPVAGVASSRLSGLVISALCASVGTLGSSTSCSCRRPAVRIAARKLARSAWPLSARYPPRRRRRSFWG